ncbi:MAG TPA: asparagine synthase (glutamine-hydrolyzing), partial [Anaerolineales bacterium]|nr:asparagine synthase (glutamine-hydrolyzing) [Anaerolineales bacterium]
ADLDRANDLLAHRGPDDSGIYISDGVGLAARRLSIIDLAGGHQPLKNEDGSVWLAYNGEVYNAPALRAELESAGHVFATHSDTEAILHAYEQWGDDCVVRLRGMFAFALWDAKRDRLLLARDRFGIKPLYYTQLGNRFAFASELRPLFSLLPDLPRRVNHEALYHLFRIGIIPAPLSAFEGVLKLPAAHSLIYENGQITLRPYWQLTNPPDGQHTQISLEAAAEQFVFRLREAVDAWRLSDVPVGSLLSGGVDSASLAALLAEIGGGQIHTFTIGFTAATHDESASAREAARAIGSHHHELTFSPADFDHLPHVVHHLEEPQCSATSVPIYLLYKACREAGFKVIMTGEGADELLGGYHWFDGDRRVRPLLRLPRLLRAALVRLPIPASASARRVLAQGTLNHTDRYWLWQQIANSHQLNTLFSSSSSERFGSVRETRQRTEGEGGLHPLDQFLLLESQTRMTDFINFEVDRMSMANSVEARPPFLDHELWEFCAALPPECKLSPNGNKLLLRLGMRGHLPPAVLSQPKRGLAAPHAGWLRGPLPAWAEEALHPTALAETGYFSPAEVNRLREQHRAGKSDHSRLLMGVLTTQLWHAEFFR